MWVLFLPNVIAVAVIIFLSFVHDSVVVFCKSDYGCTFSGEALIIAQIAHVTRSSMCDGKVRSKGQNASSDMKCTAAD